MLTAACLSYPVVAISRAGFVYASADEVDLRTANARALKLGFFGGMVVIDGEGARFRVIRVHGERVAPGEWLGKVLGALANPRMRVEIELERDAVLTLDEAKAEVRAAVRKLEQVHDEAIGGMSIVLTKVDDATTMQQLIACFHGGA